MACHLLDNDDMVNVFFDPMWEALSRHGYCDSIGGAEYRRVRDLWVREGCPHQDVHTYIVIEANRPGESGGSIGDHWRQGGAT